MRTRGKDRAPHLLRESTVSARVTIDVEDAGDTPILREYRAVKSQHLDAIVLVRLGDFYEMFGADAELAAPILGLTLTGRSFGAAGRLPMCGVPHQAVSQHLRRLLDAGQRIAVWDQVGEVVPGKLVRRSVTRVLSPGTAIDADLLVSATVSRCVAVRRDAAVAGIAALDASTGDFELLEIPAQNLSAIDDALHRLDATELLLPEDDDLPASVGAGLLRTRLPASLFDVRRGDTRILEATGAAAIHALDIDDLAAARGAAGAVLAYCDRSQLRLSADLVRVRVRRPGALMHVDGHTIRNLELLSATGKGVALLELLDRTRTAPGARLLRSWLQSPLVETAAIGERADGVATLTQQRDVAIELEAALREVRDLERLVTRCVQHSASPRDLAAIGDTCTALPHVQSIAGALAGSKLIADAAAHCVAPQALLQQLKSVLVDDPPAQARDGGCIKPGADTELDSLLASGAEARDFIAGLEQRERERTGMRSLRVGYNRVFGYYIEVPNGQRDSVPHGYERKQTLVGAERYITADLKEHEAIVLHSRERAVSREMLLLRDLESLVTDHAAALAGAARAAALLDALQSLAHVAAEQGWVRPDVDDSEVIDIEQGRHPLVERSLGPGRFVANDCTLDAAERILIITGPNMAGKSTYLRQVAIAVILAHVGSFIPAQRARIGVCDRVFTRIGAQDDLSAGMSTFMLEMAETAAILRQATARSLVVLDEIGRGTSTYDGLSIAQAVVENLHDSPQLGCRTLFATHYHELTSLADELARVRNTRVEVEEEGERVTFLHRIV
ncbi:MAG: DNA mismatch repair protein MutS, partial [Candidatus Dormibacteraeota bacterium]|nr:DNA mismatch repair protein MutS [Candidatus Dormibacteraeota bacterium]